MEKENKANTYEDTRKQRVLENKKRFEDLGILSLSKSLSDISKSENKSQKHQRQYQMRRKRENIYSLEPRRSSRIRNPVASYRDDVDIDLPRIRKRSISDSSWTSYLARPLEEVRTASFEEKADALKSAEKLQSNLQSENPSFIKSMVRSHVYSCFWLGLPRRFCEDYLPKSTVDMILEDEEGSEYEAVFISKRTGLSGGWRAFALDHKLDDGDAVVFELVEPARFKVYIVRASYSSCKVNQGSEAGNDGEETAKEHSKHRKKKKVQAKDSTMSTEDEQFQAKDSTVTKDDCSVTNVLRRSSSRRK